MVFVLEVMLYPFIDTVHMAPEGRPVSNNVTSNVARELNEMWTKADELEMVTVPDAGLATNP
ncbi:hypothetical protein GCM10007108_02960 [Thermogymnomonas acidicola]|uniref:Uncharacterized protein n=1 Tax=Thermogymnomonas acidicola TaxID=399579 RepID=A0AA37F8T9_9ARCH|nr:hypothetical protein GCM10007108_02960 [Thermogymnomonas acidicola]